MPKPPPTSPTRTRIVAGSTPSTSFARSSRSPVGVWQLVRIVVRPVAASYAASVVRGSTGAGITRWLTRSRPTTCFARANAAATAFASPWRATQATLPVALGPDLRGAGRDRVVEGGDGGPRLVADVDRLGGVARGVERGRDDRGHRFADVADDVGRERALRRRGRRLAVGALEVGRARQRLHAVALEVGAGDDRDHAGQRGGGARVDRGDRRVRVRRAQEHDDRLAGRGDVVGEAAAAGEERVVLDALHGRVRCRSGRRRRRGRRGRACRAASRSCGGGRGRGRRHGSAARPAGPRCAQPSVHASRRALATARDDV